MGTIQEQAEYVEVYMHQEFQRAMVILQDEIFVTLASDNHFSSREYF